jgi:AcrR family transcriptional regulator
MQTTEIPVHTYKKPRQPTREAILDAAELLMSQRGFNRVSLREIARESDVNLGSVTYHFGTKEKLLAAIYDRHTKPMNQRRLELLSEAGRITDRKERLHAIVRAFVIPAFSSQSDVAGGGARFTRIRAILSMEGNEAARNIIAASFDETTNLFVDAIAGCVPNADRGSILWRCHFLLGALYYTLVNGDRIDRLSGGMVKGSDHDRATEELVRATAAALQELDLTKRKAGF